MNDSQFEQRRRQLLDRFLAGEIDRPTYEQMLGEIERWEVASRAADDDASPSLGDVPTFAGPDPEALSPAATPEAAGPADRGPLSEGSELGGFRLEHCLGRGGMGVVWKAHDPVGERPVVIKVLPPELQRDPDEMARVKQSFQQIHALHHEHICPVYLLGEDPRAGSFLVMKYLDGITLSWKLSDPRRPYTGTINNLRVKDFVDLEKLR